MRQLQSYSALLSSSRPQLPLPASCERRISVNLAGGSGVSLAPRLRLVDAEVVVPLVASLTAWQRRVAQTIALDRRLERRKVFLSYKLLDIVPLQIQASRSATLDGQYRIVAIGAVLKPPAEGGLWDRLISFLKRDVGRKIDRALWRFVASEAGLGRASARRAHLKLLRLMLGIALRLQRVICTRISSRDLAHACTQLTGGFTTTAPPAMAA